MPIQVIGAGSGRTGTTSLKLALEKLGFDPCYHMTELLKDPERVVHWEDAFEGRSVNWDALFEGFHATVDFPGYLHYRALMKVYPEAKVILTVRDPERWYESAYETIYQAGPNFRNMVRIGIHYPFSRRVRHLVRAFRLAAQLWEGEFEGRFKDKAYAMARFQAFNEQVKANVPDDRLLVFTAKEGWEPLCKFLDKPVPNEPFPHANDRQTFGTADIFDILGTPKGGGIY